MVRMFNMDCMEFMRDVPDKAYDLAIVDPPYGIGAADMKMGLGNSKKCSKIKNRKWLNKRWDDSAPTSIYFKDLFRVSLNQIIWGGNYFSLPPCSHFLIWDKEIPDGLSFSDCEYAWTSYEKANRMFRYSAYLDKRDKIHPTQKPVALYKWLLTNYAKPGDKILDTHGGSMSHAIAAYDLGFDLDIIELDEDYFKEAKQRYEAHVAKYAPASEIPVTKNGEIKLF